MVGISEGYAGTVGRPLLDLGADAHVHTGFAIGRDSVGAIVTAAERAGLDRITFGDIVTPRSAWLPVYQKSILRAQQRTEVTLRIAVEVEVARPDGWLDFPTDLSGLDDISVAVSRLPLASGPADARRVQELMRTGVLNRTDVVELAAFRTGDRLDLLRPPPTRLLDETSHGDLAEGHIVRAALRKCQHLVRIREVLGKQAWRLHDWSSFRSRHRSDCV